MWLTLFFMSWFRSGFSGCQIRIERIALTSAVMQCRNHDSSHNEHSPLESAAAAGDSSAIQKVASSCRVVTKDSSPGLAQNKEGCPVAKWIIRRSNYDEKILALVKSFPSPDSSFPVSPLKLYWQNNFKSYFFIQQNHLSNDAPQEDLFTIVAIVVWDGLEDKALADKLYDVVVHKTSNFGIETDRRCGLNQT